MKNYYDFLEIHQESSQEIIEAAYKSLFKHYDPENFSTDEEKLQAKIRRNQIKEAYNVLSYPKKRTRYDKYFLKKGGKVETDRIPNDSLIILFAIVLLIVITAKFIGDLLFKHFAKLTVLIGNTPVLEIGLLLILTGIAIHFFWKALRK